MYVRYPTTSPDVDNGDVQLSMSVLFHFVMTSFMGAREMSSLNRTIGLLRLLVPKRPLHVGPRFAAVFPQRAVYVGDGIVADDIDLRPRLPDGKI